MLPEEVTIFIGKSLGTFACEVEKGAIKRFADAIDDQNPIYWDEEYAAKSRYGSMIAPPGFFGWLVKLPRGATFQVPNAVCDPPDTLENMREALAKVGYGNLLDGGMEYEFFQPIRAGDALTAKSVIKDIIEREGKTGKMVFVITETTYLNQSGQIMAKSNATAIYR